MMGRTFSLAIALSMLAGCATTRPVEQEPVDPMEDEVLAEPPAGDGATWGHDPAGAEPGEGAAPGEEPAETEDGVGAMPGLDLTEPEGDRPGAEGDGPETDADSALPETGAPAGTGRQSVPLEAETAVCPAGRAPLAVKLLVLLRHPTDPVPPLPAEGFTLAVDGATAATGVRVGQVHTLCVAPGDHEVAAHGGAISRSVRARAPGKAQLAVAGGGKGPVPGIAPGDPVQERQ
jgi:hypothetical protein